jgi:hypothetical protein
MGMLSRFRRKRRYAALTDEERMGRYVYLLNTLPASVIEKAHAAAFRDVPADRRRAMFEQLRPFLSDAEQDAAADDPTVLARLFRRAEERRAQRAQDAGSGADRDARDDIDPRTLLTSSGVAAVVSQNFLLSAVVVTYFSSGAGSLAIASEPAWVGDTYDPGTSSAFDGGGFAGDHGGGGFDGGGFGGGFDGGGFGGGDGGGGF